MGHATINVQQLAELKQRQHVDLIDVRTPVEYRETHADSARNVPLDRLDPRAIMEARQGSNGDPLYLICRSGNRSTQACTRFEGAGYTNVVSVEGGTEAWEAAGLPVVRGKKAMSLERQVRIAAGTLVLLGTVCGYLVHPGFLGLAAFVGAGLTFSGVTDTCGMAMVLAKMPWNQVRGASTCETNAADASEKDGACCSR